MYIKQVAIEGFKSYGEQITIEPFSPKINCVVGANGSGKTNFFHAIQFVLSDIFQNLRSEDRPALLHEGAGHQVLSAFVEIVFDNSDNRIPVDKEEVRLRRMIGLKKDEYLIDGKHVKKTEVMNLLEIAGFPRSNPYYVVQQGKIDSLTLMKDSERLDLVKEISGTRVYEKTRCECLKLMQETGNVKKKVIQVHQCMDKILKELDEKNEELRKYQQLDKQRKSLEYTIYDKELQDAWQKLVETETRKAELVTSLTTNLKRRKHELEARISSTETETSLSEAKLKRQESDDAKILIDDATEQLKRVTERIDELTKQLRTKKEEKNKLKTSEDEYEWKLQDEAKELEQLLSKRNVFLSKQEEYSKKIRELGSFSSDAFEMGEGSMKELLKTLHRCNEQLLQFSHVNKKALDLYVNFTMQREEFQKGQAEVDAVEEKIREWISLSDRRKDEETERTFEGIARHFREVFSEIVQGGHGDLIMIKNGGDQGDDDLDEDEPQEANLRGRVEKYIGVKVKVSFTGQGETQSMKQLSGGQKTLVALALIFAIQRYDPPPVCLFDEVDAALDPQYRAAIGNMVHHLADMSNTQFITTTFRPEVVKVADKIYGVTHKNGVSRVNVVSKEVALDFIEHDPSHNAC